MKTGKEALRPSYKPFSVLKETLISLPWPVLLVMLLIPILGVFSGYGLSRQYFLPVVVVVTAVPLGILFIRQPFNAVVIWLLVGPFFNVTPNTATRMAYWVTHRTILPLAAIVTLVICLTQKRLRFGLIEFFLLAHLLLNIFSVLYYYPNNPLPELYHVYDRTLVGTALFWLIRTIAPREVQLKRLMVAFIAMCIVQGSVGLMMNIPATRAMLPEAWVEMSALEGRTSGTFHGVSELTPTLAASMLLVAHYALYIRKRLIQIVCFVGLVLGSMSLVLGFSRGAWLASAIVAVLAIVLYRRLAPYILITAVVIVLVLSTNVFADSIAFAAERLDHQRTVDSRIISNYAHLRMIQAKPLLGWGYGNYVRYHMDFVKPVEGVAVTDPGISSHCAYLSMAVELGLLGLVTYLMPWLLLLKGSITAYKQLPQESFYSRYLLVVLWLGVAFWSVVALFTNIRLVAWGITWVQLLLGLIASVVDAGEAQPRKMVNFQYKHNSFTTQQGV